MYEFKSSKDSGENHTIQQEIIAELKIDSMAPLFVQIAAKYGWTLDSDLIAEMRAQNEKSFQAIEVQYQEATEHGGDVEVLDAMLAKARLFTKIGNWSEALSAFDVIISRPKMTIGKKIDITMEKARIYLFTMEITKLKETITVAKKLNDLGGDWDRRNRLKIYEALCFLMLRDFRQASSLFLDCIATFTCVELCSYTQFMFYAVVTSIISLSRTDLRKKMINNPQVIAVLRDSPVLHRFLHSFYKCEFAEYFQALVQVFPRISEDRFIGPHISHLMREYRVIAYSQFLEAYRSVLMSSMAKSFGISLQLLDLELSRFIAAGKLNAKIDKVGDVVETCRPDRKNGQYQETIKKGDALLNQIQRLVRVIDV